MTRVLRGAFFAASLRSNCPATLTLSLPVCFPIKWHSTAIIWSTSSKEWVGLHRHAMSAIMPMLSGDGCRSAPRSGRVPAARRTWSPPGAEGKDRLPWHALSSRPPSRALSPRL